MGSMLLMTIPTTIVHGMNDTSPLLPPLDDYFFASSSSSRGGGGGGVVTNEDDHHRQVEAIKEHLQEKQVEVVVLLEGTDPLTSSSIQARYSYTYEDIVFDRVFAPCTFSRSGSGGGCVVDFSRFHSLQAAPPTFNYGMTQ